MNEVFPTIYKKDSTGKIRAWCMELDGDKYRTIAGVHGGRMVTSKWTTAIGKNTGKVNETTGEEQALNEIESQYKKKLAVDYHNDIADVEVFKTFKPMLAVDYEKRKAKIDWKGAMIQPKLDGCRLIASRHGLFSRTGKEFVAVPHIMEELKDFFKLYPDVVLDGELYNHALKADFNKLVSLVRKTKPSDNDIQECAEKIEYHIYDIAEGSVADQPFPVRSQELDLMFSIRNYPMDKLVLVSTDKISSEDDCDNAHSLYLSEGYEGSIIRLPAPYAKGKRFNGLCKRKDFDDEEGIILSYSLGNGNFAGLPKTIEVEMSDGKVATATMTGTREFLAEFLEEFGEYQGSHATVQFFGRTPDGNLRFPVVKHVYKGKRDL